MFLVANLIEAFAKILDVVLSLYTWVIILRALLSWVTPGPLQRHRPVPVPGDGTGAAGPAVASL